LQHRHEEAEEQDLIDDFRQPFAQIRLAEGKPKARSGKFYGCKYKECLLREGGQCRPPARRLALKLSDNIVEDERRLRMSWQRNQQQRGSDKPCKGD
jgi:hypothetical protein